MTLKEQGLIQEKEQELIEGKGRELTEGKDEEKGLTVRKCCPRHHILGRRRTLDIFTKKYSLMRVNN